MNVVRVLLLESTIKVLIRKESGVGFEKIYANHSVCEKEFKLKLK